MMIINTTRITMFMIMISITVFVKMIIQKLVSYGLDFSVIPRWLDSSLKVEARGTCNGPGGVCESLRVKYLLSQFYIIFFLLYICVN
jgi:hypothetical protein